MQLTSPNHRRRHRRLRHRPRRCNRSRWATSSFSSNQIHRFCRPHRRSSRQIRVPRTQSAHRMCPLVVPRLPRIRPRPGHPRRPSTAAVARWFWSEPVPARAALAIVMVVVAQEMGLRQRKAAPPSESRVISPNRRQLRMTSIMTPHPTNLTLITNLNPPQIKISLNVPVQF